MAKKNQNSTRENVSLSADKTLEVRPWVSYEEFNKMDLRVAKILSVNDHPNADKLLVMKVDLGDHQRQIIAGLKGHYTPEALLGKNIIVLANLQSRKMRGMESAGMLLAAVTDVEGKQKIVVLTLDDDVPAGSPVS